MTGRPRRQQTRPWPKRALARPAELRLKRCPSAPRTPGTKRALVCPAESRLHRDAPRTPGDKRVERLVSFRSSQDAPAQLARLQAAGFRHFHPYPAETKQGLAGSGPLLASRAHNYDSGNPGNR